MRAIEEALEGAGADAGDVERFVHGMTVGTNALLEGRVARTALLATEGFTDLEELGRQARRSCTGCARGTRRPWRSCVAVPERAGRTASCGRSTRALCARRWTASISTPPRSACCGASGIPRTSDVRANSCARRRPRRTSPSRTRPPAPSASTNAAPPPWWTPRSLLFWRAISSG